MNYKPLYGHMIGIIIILLLASSCSINTEKDIHFLRQNFGDYYIQTIPYEEKITFTLTIEEIFKGIETPIKITSIHDTDVFVVETYEMENSINKKKEIEIVIGLDSHVNSENGTILSHFRFNSDNTYTSGSAVLKVFDKNEEIVNLGSGSGDREGKYGQFLSYNFEKEELKNRKELTFEISGLYLLTYNKK